jgi:hypothetical protein
VSLQKLGSWYLLLTISFMLVTIVNRPRPFRRIEPAIAAAGASPESSPVATGGGA